MAKYKIIAVGEEKEIQGRNGKFTVSKVRMADLDTGIDYPHVVDINGKQKVGDVVEGTISQEPWESNGRAGMNYKFKKAGGGFGGRGYNGPTAEQYARGVSVLAVSQMGITDNAEKKATMDKIYKYVMGA